MKESYYFQHDYNARNDPKLQDVLIEHGIGGIGVFWCIIEQMYEQDGFLPLKSCKSIAFALHVDCKLVESVVLDFGLFQNDGINFWSNSVKSRLSKRNEVKEVRKNAALKRWESIRKMQMQCKDDANAMQDICKEKESKGKESKGKESKYNNINSSSNKEELSEIEISGDSQKARKEKEVDYKKIVDMYHATCLSFPRIIKLSDARKQKIKIRLEEMHGDFELLQRIFDTMENSKFLKGDNRTGWKATFDWVFENPKNWVKIAEGNYNDKAKQQQNANNKNCNDEWT